VKCSPPTRSSGEFGCGCEFSLDLLVVQNEARGAMERIAAGKSVQKVHDINFTSYEAMRKVLTPRRLELLHTIKEKSPQSVYELARLLGRDLKNVNDDLAILTNIGLVELRGATTGRKKVVPWVTVDKIQVEITV
jgi:predicted transcriptional regulator